MKLLGLSLAVLALAACGSTDDTKDLFGARVCVPGATTECACPGGAKGAQACKDDGTGYQTCQCSSGSGGSAGSGGGSSTGGSAGMIGTGGAGGSWTGRATCPSPEPDGGAPLCGMLDDYCGGKLNCGCEFGECAAGGTCSCWRLSASFGEVCARFGYEGIGVQCATDVPKPRSSCVRAPLLEPGQTFPSNSYCCGN